MLSPHTLCSCLVFMLCAHALCSCLVFMLCAHALCSCFVLSSVFILCADAHAHTHAHAHAHAYTHAHAHAVLCLALLCCAGGCCPMLLTPLPVLSNPSSTPEDKGMPEITKIPQCTPASTHFQSHFLCLVLACSPPHLCCIILCSGITTAHHSSPQWHMDSDIVGMKLAWVTSSRGEKQLLHVLDHN